MPSEEKAEISGELKNNYNKRIFLFIAKKVFSPVINHIVESNAKGSHKKLFLGNLFQIWVGGVADSQIILHLTPKT